MTVYARLIISEPVRSASETWGVIVNLLTAQGDAAVKQELLSVTGAVSSLISDETIKDSPIVAYGAGPRVRFYCLYGENAITGDQANERALPTSPINGDWSVSLPCPPDDMQWVQSFLKKRSSHISVRDVRSPVNDDEDRVENNQKSTGINLEAFLKL